VSEVGRPETEEKKVKSNAGIKNINICSLWEAFLPTPDFGLPALGPKFSIKITVEPTLLYKFL
jgi:hypothetical protein